MDGRKTVTRRLVKPQPLDTLRIFYDPEEGRNIACYVAGMDVLYNFFPPYQPGDILYVRETWRQVATYIYWYKADSCVQNILWHPSIHMPKEAARIFLRVLDVHVERLQEITGAECVREGIPQESLKEVGEAFTIGQFSDLWDSTVKPANLHCYGWDANPWVWVIDFERISRDEAMREEINVPNN